MSLSDDLWVFGYGSLMWRPDFPFVQRHRARLDGYHRGFCIASTHHRGSPDRPGLVLGLDRGGSCEGVVYRVAVAQAAHVRDYLRRRELINGVYREALVPVAHIDEAGAHRVVRALAFICERAHPSYAGHLTLAEQAHLIRGASGLSGNNLDYLVNTVRHLQQLGIRERDLERLVALAAPLVAQRARLNGRDDLLTSPSATSIRRAVARLSDDMPRMSRVDRRRFMHRLNFGGDAP
jgi:cation transport protein ChaC